MCRYEHRDISRLSLSTSRVEFPTRFPIRRAIPRCCRLQVRRLGFDVPVRRTYGWTLVELPSRYPFICQHVRIDSIQLAIPFLGLSSKVGLDSILRSCMPSGYIFSLPPPSTSFPRLPSAIQSSHIVLIPIPHPPLPPIPYLST